MGKSEKLQSFLHEIQRFLGELNGSGFSELEWVGEEYGFRIVRSPRFSAVSHPSSEKEEKRLEKKPVPVTSEFVGTFHFGESKLSSGMPVKPGQTLGYVASVGMKHAVEVGEAGRLQEIFVRDGDRVEYGQTLFTYQDKNVP